MTFPFNWLLAVVLLGSCLIDLPLQFFFVAYLAQRKLRSYRHPVPK